MVKRFGKYRRGYSRNAPDEGYSRNIPDEGYSRDYLVKVILETTW